VPFTSIRGITGGRVQWARHSLMVSQVEVTGIACGAFALLIFFTKDSDKVAVELC
jgi:hypothetical protein